MQIYCKIARILTFVRLDQRGILMKSFCQKVFPNSHKIKLVEAYRLKYGRTHCKSAESIRME